MRFGFVSGTILMLPAIAAAAEHPRPTPKRFTSHQYTITFPTPAGLSYCPLPLKWIGSDHGTILFLARPRLCDGAGYASSERGFDPATVPHIEVYYGYQVGDGTPEPCRKVGTVRLLGRDRAVCAGRRGGMETRFVQALYSAGGTGGEIWLTLGTTKARFQRDYAVFVQLVQSIRTCRSSIVVKGKTSWFGDGPACRGGAY